MQVFGSVDSQASGVQKDGNVDSAAFDAENNGRGEIERKERGVGREEGERER